MQKTKKKKKVARSIPYQKLLMKKLKNHELAVAYLNNAIEESKRGDRESLEVFLLALRNLIKANGGIAYIAKKAGLGRESLYKTVSEKGNPEFRTITAITYALGIEFKFA
jgi:probable addiction module antidote protein